MKNFINTLKNIYSIEELRNKLMITLLLVFVYRLGTYIVLPGIDPNALAEFNKSGNTGLLGLLNMFVGGSFSRASIFALGIMPYISASIAMQLLTLAVPYFQKLQKDGESGRKKINQVTRYLTIAITAFQAVGYVTYLTSTAGDSIVVSKFLFALSTVFTLTAGTVFCMWMGEKITDKGIGNGTSILIMVGILARLPFSFVAEFGARTSPGSNGGLIAFIIELVVLVGIIMFIILLVQGVRKIPVEYAKRMVGGKQSGGIRQFIPLRVNASGVMPIIFAQALMFIPSFIAQYFPQSDWSQNLMGANFTHSIPYNVVYFLLVILFTYLYTALIVNPTQMADDLKRNGGFVPGIKPGQETAEHIDNVVSRITLPGAVFLALIGILPAFANMAGINQQFANFYGGTSVLIMVSVMLDTLQQIESHLLMRHYDGLLKGGSRIQGRQQLATTDTL